MDGELAASMHEEATLLSHLIDDLQDIALAEAGRLHISIERVDIADAVAASVDSQRPSAEQAGLHIDVSGLHVQADVDPARLRQVVTNLVSNAIRHTSDGDHISVDTTSDANSVTITVADTGEGISPEHLPHVFDRFYRADPSRSRETGGSGLGLAICRQLVLAHHGAIRVESTLGEGTTFRVRLPLNQNPDLASGQ